MRIEEPDHDPEAQTSRVGLAVEQEVRRDVVGANDWVTGPPEPKRSHDSQLGEVQQPADEATIGPAPIWKPGSGAAGRRPAAAAPGVPHAADGNSAWVGVGGGAVVGVGAVWAEVAELLRPEAAASQPAKAARVRGRSSAPAPPRPGGGRPPTLPTRSSTECAPTHPAARAASRRGRDRGSRPVQQSRRARPRRGDLQSARRGSACTAMRFSRLGAARSVPMPTRRCTEARCAQRRESDRNPPTIAVTPPISATTVPTPSRSRSEPEP